ncbi:hypothetical protein [Nocardia salmonicida]|uniref:hypothetical protein n=1 Tax=Nocardia salmonicida TaxID=53431 RepID=UPI0033CCFDB1
MSVERDPTVNVPRDLHARARRAVRLVRASGTTGYTMARFTAEAFAAQLRQIEKTYNNGQAILPDTDPLERGRTAE